MFHDTAYNQTTILVLAIGMQLIGAITTLHAIFLLRRGPLR